MLFNSLDFAIFLPLVFLIYWFIVYKNLRNQNILIVIASYVFYGWWDWRFLSLILLSTLVDYFVGLGIARAEKEAKRKSLLWISIVVNLGILGFFKYYNFFLDNFISAFSLFGFTINASGLNIVLPVGISFYTFQTMSYTIDIYRKKLNPTTDFISFAAFVSFFPQLVAGPIERATNLLPQFHRKRRFDYNRAVDGLRQMLWGFFKKMVIADNCARFADDIFNNYTDYSGSTLVLGALFFTVQIYGDFSGYSDIAIGTARLFGFNLMKNFAFPYFSRDIAEFWRRWHISLSTWFRDYVYIPLGGSRSSTFISIRNVFIIFIVSGFWHGANWTFIVWGALNALYFLPLFLVKRHRTHLDVVAQDRVFPSLREVWGIMSTFALTVFAWIFFRAENINHALAYIADIFNRSLFSKPEFAFSKTNLVLLMIILFFFGVEWMGRDQEYALEKFGFDWNKYWRYGFYISLAFVTIAFSGAQEQFIYFQF